MPARLYLFTLEVTPTEVGTTYNPLPPHLTLMSRFWSAFSPNEIAQHVAPLFENVTPITLTFGEQARLGPQQTPVHLIENTLQLHALHAKLKNVLDKLGVTYTKPEYIGRGHKPHVSIRPGISFGQGYQQISRTVYLVEVHIEGTEHQRTIQTKFQLGDKHGSQIITTV